MRSQFSSGRKRITASATPRLDETYDLLGLNLIAPDQIMPAGETPYAINSRRFAKNETDSRVAVHTRSGSTVFSRPVGETADVANVTASTGDLSLTPGLLIAQSFTAGSNGVLTKIELEVKKVVSGNGPLIIEIYTDNSDVPGVKVAQGSILPSLIGSSFAYVGADFIDAPTIVSGVKYWKILKIQEHGTGTYGFNKTAGSRLLTQDSGEAGWTVTSEGFRFKTYFSTAGEIKGYTRRAPQDLAYRTLFALGTNLYAVPDSPATATSIDSTIDGSAEFVRFAQVDDKTFFVDGKSSAKWWNGTDTPTVIGGVAGAPSHVIIYQNRSMFVPTGDPTRVNFSALYSFEDYPSVNFFYVPSPKSPDHITGWAEFQDGLTIFTHDTKHIVFGSSIGTFTRKQAVGTKGALSQEAIAIDRNFIYFMAPDKHIYRYNGSTDEILSLKMEPEFQSILNPKKVRLHLYRNQLHVYYNTKADPTFNRKAVYDLGQEQWFRDTGRSVVGSLDTPQNDGAMIEFSSRAGWLFNGESGASDCGKAIDFKYWTNYKMYGSGIAKDRVRKFRPIVRPSSAPYYLKVGKDVDFNNRPDMRNYLVDSGGTKWGSFTWGDGTKWGGGKEVIDNASAMSGRGKLTQYRFEHSSVNNVVWLLGYASMIKSGRAR